jgi:hypothetical protein
LFGLTEATSDATFKLDAYAVRRIRSAGNNASKAILPMMAKIAP